MPCSVVSTMIMPSSYSDLDPNIMEALLCNQNWKKGKGRWMMRTLMWQKFSNLEIVKKLIVPKTLPKIPTTTTM
ncbi:hypothetical protein Goarm_020477, partial [Gossypium armourianum]|nr:hypothetical protein [Gossypium armourianum]